MSDHLALLLILAGLHVMECCQVVPHGTVVFQPAWWRGHTAARSSALMRVNRGRFVFLNPFNTRAHVLVTGLPHIMPTAEGVLDVSPEEDNTLQRRPFVPWSTVGPARASESSVLCVGLGVLPCSSPAAARIWARVLNSLRTAAPTRRAVLAERWLRLRFSPAIASRRVARTERACATLELVASNTFMILVAGAVIVSQRPSTTVLLGFLGAGVVSGLAIALTFWFAHARLEPRAWVTRLGRAALMSACFPVAFRARSTLGRETLALAHPVAAAAALLPADRAHPLLAEMLRRWRHPTSQPGAGSIDETQLTRAALEVSRLIIAAARILEIDEASLATPPALNDPAVRSWCPRCQATYVHAGGTCAECPGVPLREVRR